MPVDKLFMKTDKIYNYESNCIRSVKMVTMHEGDGCVVKRKCFSPNLDIYF